MAVELPATIDKYQIIGVIGKGAMGVVYKAHDSRLDRDLAVKVMSPRLSGNDDFVRLFEREGRAAARLNHPNVVTVFDSGFVGDDQPFLVMEFVKGKDLSAVLTEEKLTLERGLRVVRDVLLGLEHAHAHGVIHRDIKPANILLCQGDVTKIADFGLARIVKPDATGTGGDIGTPRYMSPEQVRGQVVDERSDLFAVGAVLYEMVAGKKAFNSEQLEALYYAILNEDPDFSCIDVRLRSVVQRALAKSRDVRFQTSREFLGEIERLIVGLAAGQAAPRSGSDDGLATHPPPAPPADLDPKRASVAPADSAQVSHSAVRASARFWGRRIVAYARRTPPLLIALHTGAPVMALFFERRFS